MNWGHFRSTLWLRWRILVNRIRRTGKLSNFFLGVLVLLGVAAAVGSFSLALSVGREELPGAEPFDVLLMWAILGAIFLFSWMIGLVADLQRSDAMSFKRLLHLPVSLRWVFLYNYLSSFVSLSMVLFVPAMLGLVVATALEGGSAGAGAAALTLLGVVGFLGLVTALTYQLRGWLARLMEDKRRGRSVVAAITIGFVLVAQVPNLLHWSMRDGSREERRRAAEERIELTRKATAGGSEQSAARDTLDELRVRKRQHEAVIEERVMLGAQVVPLGWLPLGARAAFEERWGAALWPPLGMLAIACLSLWRSYRTTVVAVVGGGRASTSSGGAKSRARPLDALVTPENVRAVEPHASPSPRFVERELPFCDEGTAVVGLAGLRSILRAPEARILLLSPIIMLGIFGVMLANNPDRGLLQRFLPMVSLGAIMLGLLSVGQLMQNQFGLDRQGFRALVLSPIPRHSILRGKNLALAPLALGASFLALLGLQLLVPTDAAHVVGGCLQALTAYLILCLVGNVTSIMVPMRLVENGLKVANARWRVVVFQIAAVFAMPLALSPLLLPALVESLFGDAAWARGLPLFALLHAGGLALTLALYLWVTKGQGELLQSREQRILEELTRS